MSRAARVGVLALVALAAAGCPAPPVVPATFNFDRPADVELVCLRVPVLGNGRAALSVNTVLPRPLSDCLADPNTNRTVTYETQGETTTVLARDNGVREANDPAFPTQEPGVFGYRLFSLVTQSNRGELAVVALHPEFDTGPVDNDRMVPGFTFIPVGRFPGAIAVDPRGINALNVISATGPSNEYVPRTGGVTYVANTGEHTVTVLDNSRLLSPVTHRLPTNGYAPVNTAASPTLEGVSEFVELRLPGAPRDLVVVPVGTNCAAAGSTCRYMLYITVPELGAVHAYDVTDARRPVALPPLHLVSVGGVRGDAGGMDASLDGAMGGGEGGADGGVAGPYPTVLSVSEADAMTPARIYVADESQPFVHVLATGAMGELTEIAQLTTNVPTRFLAVSPRLPENEDLQADALTGRRFVYAISHVDGSVMVLDPTQPSRGPLRVNVIADRPECADGPTFDPRTCPRIDPRETRFDRIPLLGPARVVTFVNRDVPTDDPSCIPARRNPDDMQPGGAVRGDPRARRCAPDATGEPGAGPRTLRGVQAIIGLQAGPLQVVELRDPDRSCPLALRTVVFPVGTSSVSRPFQPHVPRATLPFTPGPAITNGPTLLVNNSTSTSSEQLPRIVPLSGPTDNARCDATSSPPHCIQLPPTPRPAGVPAGAEITDPLATRDDTWTITYQGVLPMLAINTAQFSDAPGMPNKLVLDAPGANFCERGVLAAEPGVRVGDRVVIASASPRVIEPTVDAGMLPPGLDAGTGATPEEDDRFCRGVFGTAASPCNRDLVIDQASNGRLVLSFPSVPSSVSGVSIVGSGGNCGGPQFLEPGEPGRDTAALRAALRRCFPQAVRIEVRAGDSWIVTGARAGYQHNVVRDASDSCVQDPARFPTGRLVEGTRYDSPAFSVFIAPGTQSGVRVPPPRGTAFQFTVTGGTTPLAIEGGWLPSALRYSCGSQRLYIVDQTGAAMFEYWVGSMVMRRTFN